ncbi:major facilitator superfamily domain-containing protein [Armillaria luteobubalina]|uniref:Major facilitator superfamily domain-containing protein n=1 Tax=Armillaria luteobubalina TaxID=153913 RepID=A0AA39QBV3_9AGAR|nr:major facilitator superfamily domain-containing protein [Armillaria luteobubalina]
MTGGSLTSLGTNEANAGKLTGHAYIYGPKQLHLPILTIGFLGIQLFWSVEQSYGSPYLLSLGLSKSTMAMVFVAGPLSGLIVQPLIGVLADGCTSRWGRRRPYMIGGVLICISAMLLLGWTRQVGAWFTSKQSLVVWLGVLSIYFIDFSINAVMAVDRALLVDTLPASQQPAANAWAAAMFSLGSVIGFFIGNLDLPSLLPFLGHAELEVFSIIVSFLLLAGHVSMALLVKEKVLLTTASSPKSPLIRTFIQQFKTIVTNIRTLPRLIKQICIIQFFTWISWFPLLFYTTLYIGDLHKREYYTSLLLTESVGPSTLGIINSTVISRQDDMDGLEEASTRLGARALFFSSILALSTNVLLPFFIIKTRHKSVRHINAGYDNTRVRNETDGYTSNRTAAGKLWASWSIPDAIKVHLASLWAVSHAVFAGCMLATFFTSSVKGATVLITVTGFSWAIVQWAPFALLGEAILTESTSGTGDSGVIMLTDTRSFNAGVEEVVFEDPDHDSDSDAESDRTDRESSRTILMGNPDAGVSRVNISGNRAGLDEDEEEEEGEDAVLVGRRRPDLEVGETGEGVTTEDLSAKAGIILGIHNIFVVIPQFLVTGVSSIIFAVFDKDTRDSSSANNGVGTASALNAAGGSNSVVYVFRIGGMAALIAFVLSWRLAKELRHR